LAYSMLHYSYRACRKVPQSFWLYYPASCHSYCTISHVVFCMGNLQVLLAVPVPVPVNYLYPPCGYGFAHGSAFSYLGYTHTRTRGGLLAGLLNDN
jgi:hypothetical protein